jgi:hypothetical protein
MADEEKKYLITAEAQVENAVANLARLEAAMTRLGEAERRMAGTASASNNVTTQAQANVDAINREVAAYENLNRAQRESQGGLARTSSAMTTRESLVETKAGVTGYSGIEKEADAAMQRITKTRYDKEMTALSQSTTEIQNLKAQRNAGLQYTDFSRTIGASGNEKVVATTYKEIGGSIREVSSAVTENGAAVSKTTTAYTRMGDGIYQANKTTQEFTDTAQKGVGTLEHLAQRISFMAEWFAFYAVIQLVQKGLQDWNQAQIALSDEMANFEIVTRGSNASAETYLNTVNAISKATAINPAEIGPGVVAQMRVFNAPSDLALRAAQVQRVTGVDNAHVQREIMGLRLQFPDRSTINILDAFSGALKRSSLNAEELFGLLETAGPLSQQFNTGLEQILGMMAGLSTVTSESGQAVELFMRQMDQLYTKPATRAKIEELTGKPMSGIDLATGQEVRRPLYEVMGDIAKLEPSGVQEISNTITNTLGQKTKQLFMAIINGWANVEDATKSAMNSQGEFLSQNETKMKSYTAAIDGASAAWQRMLRGMQGSKEVIAFINVVTDFLNFIEAKQAQSKEGNFFERAVANLAIPAPVASYIISNLSGREAAKKQAQFETERREFLQDRLDVDRRPSKSQALVSSVRFPEQQVTTVSRSATALAERFYEQAMQQRVQGAATYMMGGPTENKEYIESIKRMIGVNETQIAVVNELTGEVVVTTKDQVMYQDALKKAADILNRTPEEWAQGFLRGREPASLWGGKTPADYQIPKQKFELPAMGFDFTAARKAMEQNIASYRGQFPEATGGKTDTEVLNLMGISERFTVFTDQFGNALGSVDVPLQYLANAATNAAGALAGLSFISPPEGVSLGTFGAGIEARAGYYDKLLAANSPEPPKVRKQIFADETGTYKTKGEFSDQAIALANAAEGKYWSKALSNSQQANELLKQIASGVRSFAEKLLAPTAVTEGDMALAKTGGYKDKWDEPVRKVQDVLDRRKGDNPNLGPWKGFAEAMGIDLSSKDSTAVTGEQFKSKFYSGQMAPEFYDKYSKEGFLASAKEELAAQQG